MNDGNSPFAGSAGPTLHESARPERGWRLLGLVGCAFFAAHAAYHSATGHPDHMFWICHLAALFVGVGLLFHLPTLNAAGTLILLIGCPFWILGLLFGDEFLPTSTLTHAGGLLLGLIGVRHLGLPPGAWWKTALGVALLIAGSRLFSPELNVNLAIRPWAGWEPFYPVPWLYHVQLWTQWCFGLALGDFTLRRTIARRRPIGT
jgi:hypothetical protein